MSNLNSENYDASGASGRWLNEHCEDCLRRHRLCEDCKDYYRNEQMDRRENARLDGREPEPVSFEFWID